MAAVLEDTLGQRNATPTEPVRIGVTHGTARLLTPRLVDLPGRYPGLSVELVVRERFDDLIEDRLDLAIRVGRPADVSLATVLHRGGWVD
jgi:DNA-binding transcriptional LysR family regulator